MEKKTSPTFGGQSNQNGQQPKNNMFAMGVKKPEDKQENSSKES